MAGGGFCDRTGQVFWNMECYVVHELDSRELKAMKRLLINVLLCS